MEVNLVRFKKNGSLKVFPLSDDSTVIGRNHTCDLRIPLISVSKRHCQVDVETEAVKIRDLNSHNGTYLNGKRITEDVVEAGSYIKVGPLIFGIQIDGEPKDIAHPDVAIEEKLQKDKATKEAKAEEPGDEQFMSFAELDEAEIPETTQEAASEQLDGLAGLEEIGSLEDSKNIEDKQLDSSTEPEELVSLEASEEGGDELFSKLAGLEDGDLLEEAKDVGDEQFGDLTELEDDVSLEKPGDAKDEEFGNLPEADDSDSSGETDII